MPKTIQMALNRVEGDLEVKVTIDNGVVTDAWMIGTMYRGIEKMMAGRAALDGLVITPRVCGIAALVIFLQQLELLRIFPALLSPIMVVFFDIWFLLLKNCKMMYAMSL